MLLGCDLSTLWDQVVVTAVVVPDTRVSTTRVRPRETEVLDSDDDDDETNNAKLSAEETGKRTRIWEEMNKDYLQAQKDRSRPRASLCHIVPTAAHLT